MRANPAIAAIWMVSALLLLGGVAFAEAAPAAAPAKPKIGIMKFDASKDLDPAMVTVLYDGLMAQMVKSKRYTVVDWREIDRVLKVVSAAQPNVSEDDAKRMTVKQLGLEKMYIGSVAKMGSKYRVSVKVLNLDLSVDTVEQGSADSEDGLEKCIMGIADQLIYSGKELEDRVAQRAAGEATRKGELEEAAWLRAKKADTAAAYQSFLASFPESTHAKDAKANYDREFVAGSWIWLDDNAKDGKGVMMSITQKDDAVVVTNFDGTELKGTYTDGRLVARHVSTSGQGAAFSTQTTILTATMNKDGTLEAKENYQRDTPGLIGRGTYRTYKGTMTRRQDNR